MPITLDTPPPQTDPQDWPHALGRLFAPDPRDRQFALREVRHDLLAEGPIEKLPNFWNHLPPAVLDQGRTSSCVGHGVAAKLMGHPVPLGAVNSNRKKKLPVDAFRFYAIAQTLDEWPGQEPSYYGTSVRAGIKAAQQYGLVQSYHFISGIEEMLRFVLNPRMGGGLLMGTDWKSGMWDTDEDGFIHYDGVTEGGHCWYIYGASRSRRAFRFQNSWGTSWGQKGRAWVSFSDVEKMMGDYGDCYAVVETGTPAALVAEVV
jgi:hypothetical protein